MDSLTIDEALRYYTAGCMIVVKGGKAERITKDVEGQKYYDLYKKENAQQIKNLKGNVKLSIDIIPLYKEKVKY